MSTNNRWRLSAHCTKCQRTITHSKHAKDGHAWNDEDAAIWRKLGMVGTHCAKCGPVDAQTRTMLLSGVWWPDHMRPMARGIAHNDNGDERTGT